MTAVADRIGRHFVRSEPRRRAAGYIRGLLGDAPRKNGWQLAEALGEATPDGVQHLLARADWDADAGRDDLVGYVAEHLGRPDGVLVVDETGFLKKGTKSVGVARQYTGTAGRIENAQVGVFLGYSSTKGRALIDRALYLPNEWAGDAGRRAEAGVPGGVGFATKIVLARRMVERAVAAGVPAKWVTADAVYGADYHFRIALEAVGLGYVVGVRTDFAVAAGAGEGALGRGAGRRLAPAELRGRSQGAAAVRLGAAADQLPRAGGVRPVAAHPAERVRPGRGGVLRLRRPARHDAAGAGAGGRDAVGD